MIIFRYLSREVLITTLAVTSVLLLIMMSTHFIGYMEDAAAGELDTSVVVKLVIHRIPFFLELLLPLGLFLGILIAHGRLYVDSEMVVMQACGVSGYRVLVYTFGPALVIAILSGVVSLYLTPLGLSVVKQTLAEQSNRANFETLVPGTFHETIGGQVVYARDMDDDGRLVDVFVSGGTGVQGSFVINALKGEQRYIEGQGRYIVLIDGHRYQGIPSISQFDELAFREYGLLLPNPEPASSVRHIDTIPTLELLGSEESSYLSRFHWRLSIPVLTLVVVLLAVPLAKTNPRRGRYSKLIPSIIIYQAYVVALTSARSAAEQGSEGPWIVWLVHSVAVAVSLSFIRFELFWSRVLQLVPNMSNVVKKVRQK